jgi:glycoside/pentoside/hexuronide:cation symporter, GPH family
MTQNVPQVSTKEKLGYALGDVATNFFFQSMILYQTKFYTDTVGLSPAVVGTMFLIVRLADAFFDPIIGALADRTQTKWGKFRPWVLWTAIPFGVAFWAMYVIPDVGPQGKLVYAVITYVLVMILYSANNTPYSALLGVMSSDSRERSLIARYRFIAAILGQLIIQTFVGPMVDKFGGGDPNSAEGWAITMGIFGVVMVFCNFVVFATTKERVLPNPQQKQSIKEDVKNVFGCKPWLAMFILTLVVFTMLVVRGSSLNSLFTYYIDHPSIGRFLEGWGLMAPATGEVTGLRVILTQDWMNLLIRPDYSNALAVGFSFFNVLGSVVQIMFIPLSKPLADRFGKKTVFVAGAGVTTLATFGMFLVSPTELHLVFWLSVLWSAGWGPTIPLLWLMIADTADYSEWQTSRRATGFMYAGILFALKAGLGLGGAMAGWILGLFGYVGNQPQTETAILGIRLGASVFPGVLLIIGLVCLVAYPISKSLNIRIQDELAERRRKFAAASG